MIYSTAEYMSKSPLHQQDWQILGALSDSRIWIWILLQLKSVPQSGERGNHIFPGFVPAQIWIMTAVLCIQTDEL